jgi:hypothetical protein
VEVLFRTAARQFLENLYFLGVSHSVPSLLFGIDTLSTRMKTAVLTHRNLIIII